MAPVSNPLPISLPGECAKAAKIMRKFADPVNGLDSIIPPSILRRAKGFCFMSVAKAGFLFSARAGSGVVIAKLPDGTWSAPSAVGTAGGGFGFQVGVEVAEFFIVLNSKQAVRSFMAKGSITLGGNMSIAAGPLGRNLEGTGSLSSKGSIAAMYSYSRSKGLFGGASVEGAIIVERSDANSKAYGQNVTATQLLSGAIDPPPWADTLISTITRLTNSGSSYNGYDDPYGRMPIEGDEGDDSDDDGFGRGGRGGREEAPTGGYAFGSAYAAGGSSGAGGFSPEREKSRISSMLGSVGRTRSGSGGSKGGRGGGEVEDPFASQASFGASGGGGNGGGGAGGPKVEGEARFETQFSRLEDDSDDGFPRFSFPTSTAAGSSPALNSSTSTRPKPPTTLSRENSFGLSGLGGGGDGGGGGGKTKLTKTKARSGSANSAGLRERAGQMSWGGGGDGRGDGRDSFDSLDDEREQYRRFGGTAEEWTGGAGAKEKRGGGMMGRFRSSTYSSASSPVTAFDPSALSSSFSATNANASKHKSRLRSSTAPSSKKSPFDDDSYSGSFSRTTTRDSFSSSDNGGGDSNSRPSLNRALSKPWDSEDESYFAAPPSLKPQQSAPYASYSPSRPATTALPSVAHGARTPGGHTPLDLREVEADFATAMDLARNGGEAEVGSYSAGTRSRSSTVTAGGGRSRSGTVTAPGAGGGGGLLVEGERPAGVGKDGIGWAVGLFDFPGVESTDLPFLKNDLLTLLNRDDAEWWRARKGLREGMVPRNYLEAHFD